MYFEGRELKPYGEPVKTADLVVGRVYFRVSCGTFLAGQRWDESRDDADSAGGYESWTRRPAVLLAPTGKWDRHVRPIEVPEDWM
jgi:hypothetical protein